MRAARHRLRLHQVTRTDMKSRAVKRLLGPVLLAILAACGGGGGGSVGPIVTGSVVKGPVSGATVCAYEITAGAKGAAIPADAAAGATGSISGGCYVTGADGSYALALPVSAAGEILLESTGGKFCSDEFRVANDACAAPATLVDLGTAVSPAPAETTAVVVRSAPGSSDRANARFHIVGGCFAQEENADRFLAELVQKGFEAHRLSKYGDLHPVAFGSYARKADALEALAAMKSQGISAAWLLVR